MQTVSQAFDKIVINIIGRFCCITVLHLRADQANDNCLFFRLFQAATACADWFHFRFFFHYSNSGSDHRPDSPIKTSPEVAIFMSQTASLSAVVTDGIIVKNAFGTTTSSS